MSNVSKGIKMLRKDQKEILEIKNTVIVKKDCMSSSVNLTQPRKESVSLSTRVQKLPKLKWREKNNKR